LQPLLSDKTLCAVDVLHGQGPLQVRHRQYVHHLLIYCKILFWLHLRRQLRALAAHPDAPRAPLTT
jgi:hypothetical protein